MSVLERRERIRRRFLDAGFTKVGFTSADPVDDHASAWVAAGRHASMGYMARAPSERAQPRALMPEARTVVCVAAAYPPGDGRQPIAAYACADDYHRTMKAALRSAVAALERDEPGLRARVCVDTAPLLERALAARAGLGWIGRNTMLMDGEHGPWLLLGEVLLDVALPPDAPVVDRCGTCTACLDACPTGALDGPHALDARRCLSYWTIEHRGPLPEAWAGALGHRAFGCDDCLVACPFGERAGEAAARGPGAAEAGARGSRADGTVARDPASEERAASPQPSAAGPPAPIRPRPDLAGLDLDGLRARARASFRRHLASTPVERARKHGLLRNLQACRPPPAARDEARARR